MLQRDVSDSTWKETNKRTTSISTDSGYRLVAQLNRKRTATERNSTLSLEKTKDLCKALMPIKKKKN